MRTSTILKSAGGVLAFSSLLLVIPSQASASNYCSNVDWRCARDTYFNKGYAYDSTQGGSPPGGGASLVHVKIRGWHSHAIEFKSFDRNGGLVDDFSRHGTWGENAWYDSSKVRTVQVTLSGRSTLTDTVDGDHCYYEDKHGNLQRATDRPCTSH